MKRKYSITLLENAWPPEDFDTAGQILADTRTQPPEKLGQGLYVVHFPGEVPIEAEIKLAGDIVTRTTCDCAVYTKDGKCAHILAGLILLRGERGKKKTPKKRKPATPSMNIKTALNSVQLNDLKLFCQDYARQDNAFSLLLKTRFIRNLPSDSFPDKYDTLLGQLVRIDRTGKVRLNRSERKTLSFMVESMLLHFDEAMVDKLYTEAFEILSALLARVHMTVDRNEEYAEYFKLEIRSIYEKLTVYLKAPIAPELKQTAVHFCLELADRSKYRIMDYFFNAASVIAPTAFELNLSTALFSLITSKIGADDAIENPWLPVGAMVFFQANASAEARKAFHRVGQIRFAHAVEILHNLQEHACIVWLIEQVDISLYRPKNQIRIFRKVFEAADNLDRIDQLEKYGIELMILAQDISYFEALLQHPAIPSGKIEMETERRIIGELEGDAQEKLLAEYYIASGKQNELLDLMAQKADIDFFIRHDVHVLPGLKHELMQAYLNLIEDHLKHYAGNVNVDLIQKWRVHFEMLNLNSEIGEILSKLEEAHPERKILFGNLKKR